MLTRCSTTTVLSAFTRLSFSSIFDFMPVCFYACQFYPRTKISWIVKQHLVSTSADSNAIVFIRRNHSYRDHNHRYLAEYINNET